MLSLIWKTTATHQTMADHAASSIVLAVAILPIHGKTSVRPSSIRLVPSLTSVRWRLTTRQSASTSIAWAVCLSMTQPASPSSLPTRARSPRQPTDWAHISCSLSIRLMLTVPSWVWTDRHWQLAVWPWVSCLAWPPSWNWRFVLARDTTTRAWLSGWCHPPILNML